ncbi:hypothetical protein BDK51DRAFT_39673 [Blyttiomyces helicus]|uniref:UBZ3-type domain-containing protein n=1 Tax=Blyttiomyces helicus TaxID=388810 RepID=A0A4P9W8K3_9FUNG|nr:hypothetical protein BDK51DRAFT_39673 [Blyttiomyces helicus]|eukprot:RKO88442.1 hypothetical protein BDK51DRAFT_39673 [Blyttiomyces helicus]
MGAHKAMQPPIVSVDRIRDWLGILASEMYSRLQEEFEEKSRWPKTFVVWIVPSSSEDSTSGSILISLCRLGQVSYHLANAPASRSKSCPMPARVKVKSAATLIDRAWSLVGKDDLVPCAGLSMSATGLTKEEAGGEGMARWLARAAPGGAARDASEGGGRNDVAPSEDGGQGGPIPPPSPAPAVDASPLSRSPVKGLHAFFPPATPAPSSPSRIAPPATALPASIPTSPPASTSPAHHCTTCGVRLPDDERDRQEHADFHFAMEVSRAGEQTAVPTPGKRKREATAKGEGRGRITHFFARKDDGGGSRDDGRRPG